MNYEDCMEMNDEVNTSTPKSLSDLIRNFCSKISIENPVYIDLFEEKYSVISECFHNVREKIKSDGGEIIYGWSIWEWPGIFVEAEHHAVWKSPLGELIDITPKPTGEERILFLPDPEKIYDWENNKRIDNIRFAISGEPCVKEFIKNAGDMAIFLENHSEGLTISFNPDDLYPLASRQKILMEEIKRLDRKIKRNSLLKIVPKNSPCPCGSGKKYKYCHGKR